MHETLKALILDSQEAPLETGVPRRLKVRAVPGKATVLIGVRRCGKSTYALQQVERLLEEGVPRENVLFLNLFDDRLAGLAHEGLGLVTEAYFSLYPEKKGKETVHCFFDEIQAVPGWEPFVDRLMRTEKCRVTLTGSSARMLSKEIATQMRGRALSWELFPFSFREFLDAKGLDASGPLSTRRRLLVQKAFEEYQETGGFPEVVGLDKGLRVKTHQEYFHAILYRDLVERHPAAIITLKCCEIRQHERRDRPDEGRQIEDRQHDGDEGEHQRDLEKAEAPETHAPACPALSRTHGLGLRELRFYRRFDQPSVPALWVFGIKGRGCLRNA